MKIDRTKGGRWWDKKIDEYFEKPTIIDDLAYYLHCKDQPKESRVPQVTYMFNKKNPIIKQEYLNAERIIKINKIRKLNSED